MRKWEAEQNREISRGYSDRWTTPRQEIFSLLMKSQQHLSAKEIYALLQPSNSEIGIATVYRTLDRLDKAGLLRKIQCHDGQFRYEYKRGDQSDHHHHLICTDCGKIVNYRDFEKRSFNWCAKPRNSWRKNSDSSSGTTILNFWGSARSAAREDRNF